MFTLFKVIQYILLKIHMYGIFLHWCPKTNWSFNQQNED